MKRDLPSSTLKSPNTAQNTSSGPLYMIPKRDLGGPKRGLVFVVSITAPFFFFKQFLEKTVLYSNYQVLRRAAAPRAHRSIDAHHCRPSYSCS